MPDDEITREVVLKDYAWATVPEIAICRCASGKVIAVVQIDEALKGASGEFENPGALRSLAALFDRAADELFEEQNRGES